MKHTCQTQVCHGSHKYCVCLSVLPGFTVCVFVSESWARTVQWIHEFARDGGGAARKNACGSCALHEMASSASACTERPFVGFSATDMMVQWKTESLKKQCYMMRQHRPSCTQALQRPMRSLRLGTAPPCPGKCRHLSAFLTQSPCNGNTHSHASWRAGHDLE